VELDLDEKYNLQLLEHARDEEERNATFMKQAPTLNAQIARLTAENAHLRNALDDAEACPQADAFLAVFPESEVILPRKDLTVHHEEVIVERYDQKLKVMKAELYEPARWEFEKQRVYYERAIVCLAAETQAKMCEKLMEHRIVAIAKWQLQQSRRHWMI
jgi:hypothetical protein